MRVPGTRNGSVMLGGLLALAVLWIGLAEQPVTTASAAPQSAEPAIRAVLDEQAAAWNRGDVAGYMQGYWKSEQMTFSGASGVTRGWQAVFDRYRTRYPDRKAMGQLAFSEIEITMLGPDAAMVLGRWQLERETDRPGGVFTLVARRLPEGWRVIHDHTSLVPSN